MFLAEIDPIQIAIIVIAMLGGFFQWIWSLIKQSQEEAARAKAPPTAEEEQKSREDVWKKQIQVPNTPPPLPPLAPQAPTTANDPWAAAKEIFEQIKKEAAGQTQLPPVKPQRPASAKRAPAYVPPALPTPQVAAVAAPVVNPPVAPIIHATPAAKAASDRQDSLELLKGLLASPTSIRQAVLMREILGPPKALQSSADSPF